MPAYWGHHGGAVLARLLAFLCFFKPSCAQVSVIQTVVLPCRASHFIDCLRVRKTTGTFDPPFPVCQGVPGTGLVSRFRWTVCLSFLLVSCRWHVAMPSASDWVFVALGTVWFPRGVCSAGSCFPHPLPNSSQTGGFQRTLGDGFLARKIPTIRLRVCNPFSEQTAQGVSIVVWSVCLVCRVFAKELGDAVVGASLQPT